MKHGSAQKQNMICFGQGNSLLCKGLIGNHNSTVSTVVFDGPNDLLYRMHSNWRGMIFTLDYSNLSKPIEYQVGAIIICLWCFEYGGFSIIKKSLDKIFKVQTALLFHLIVQAFLFYLREVRLATGK